MERTDARRAMEVSVSREWSDTLVGTSSPLPGARRPIRHLARWAALAWILVAASPVLPALAAGEGGSPPGPALPPSALFLAAVRKRPGVTALPSGLLYQVVREGTGAAPRPGDVVTVRYRGTTADGTEFESTLEGPPAVFPVDGVIPGLSEALLLMREGSRWTLHIPPDLAYGEEGAGEKIGPGEVLVFDLELVTVN